ncbi:MAG: AAA family ATPase [Alphaproteobacteria bacterium]|nr:AAA family ATPase [Alphaproteobacteria bacterium]
MKLVSISIRNFRSIGRDVTIPVDGMNLLVGPNNAGKSAIVLGIQLALMLGRGEQGRIDSDLIPAPWRMNLRIERDHHNHDHGALPAFGLAFRLDDGKSDRQFSAPFHAVYKGEEQTLSEIVFWWTAQSRRDEKTHNEVRLQWSLAAKLANLGETRSQIMGHLSGLAPSAPSKTGHPASPSMEKKVTEHDQLRAIYEKYFINAVPSCSLTLAVRERHTDAVRRLQEWHSPEPGPSASGLRAKFRVAENQIIRLLGLKEGTELTISKDGNRLRIDPPDGHYMEAEHYGTGTSQIISLVVDALDDSNKVIVIEEPEAFLHPPLQRELLTFLSEHSHNALIMSTHAPALVDQIALLASEDRPGRVFNVRRPADGTTCSEAISMREKYEALENLGATPSDLLMTNFVIWVEGPSDRIYIKHWLNLYDESLVEGRDYSIMFYGGSNIAHLELDSSTARDLIRLLDIHHRMALVLDSDRTSSGDALKPHANRIVHESPDRVWVTSGREIENYLDFPTLRKLFSGEPEEPWTSFASLHKVFPAYAAAKTDKARAYVSERKRVDAKFEQLPQDLKTKIECLAKLIQFGP